MTGSVHHEDEEEDDGGNHMIHVSEQEHQHEEEHDHLHHPGFGGSTEFIGDEVDFERGRLHDQESSRGSAMMDHQHFTRHNHQDEHAGEHHHHGHHRHHNFGHNSHHGYHGHHNSALVKGGEGEEEHHMGPNKCIHSSHHHYYDRRRNGIPDCDDNELSKTKDQDPTQNQQPKDSQSSNLQDQKDQQSFTQQQPQQEQQSQKLIHDSHKRCCNSTLLVVTDCKACNNLTGNRRDSDADVEEEGGDDSGHDDHDIDTGGLV